MSHFSGFSVFVYFSVFSVFFWFWEPCYILTNRNTISVSRDYILTNRNTISVSCNYTLSGVARGGAQGTATSGKVSFKEKL